MKRFKPSSGVGLALLGTLVLAACANETQTPSAVDVDLIAAMDHVGDGYVEHFTVCKTYVGGIGPAVTVDWSVVRESGQPGASGSVVLADGECSEIYDYVNDGFSNNGLEEQTVTVTEQPVPGYATSYVRTSRAAIDAPIVTDPEVVGNSASGVMLSNPDNGFQVDFINTAVALEGCTPGYYKNLKKHSGAWDDAGLDPDDAVSSLFAEAANVPYAALGAATLHEGLSFQGGDSIEEKAEILLRAAIAAALNAANPNVSYPLSLADVVGETNAALASGDPDVIIGLASDLDIMNNLGCPI